MNNDTEPVTSFDAVRHSYAGVVYQLLDVADLDTGPLLYDGAYTVSAGPVQVTFAAQSVDISFPDPDGEEYDTVTLTVTGTHSIGSIVTVVEALLSHPAVTR